MQQLAMATRRHMHDFGTTSEQIARVAVDQRNCAMRNPQAFFRDPITVEDVLTSRMIADPLRLLDCSLETDGAVAVVVTSADRARDLKQRPVLISGVAQGAPSRHYMMGGMLYRDDPWDTAAVRAARELYASAGMVPEDVDVAMLYDVTSSMVLWQLEAYGFCKPGEAGPFVEAGGMNWPDGKLPVNTNGGSLSEAYVHGFNLILEAVRQLRGTSTCQVPDAEVALTNGGVPIPTSALLLRR
jgi:acetyl-CoA acetyltransferase